MSWDVQELLAKGWRKWNDKTDKDGCVLLLCPLSELKNLPHGTELESISGVKVKIGTDWIDTDVRGGLLAYGVRA